MATSCSDYNTASDAAYGVNCSDVRRDPDDHAGLCTACEVLRVDGEIEIDQDTGGDVDF